MKRYETKFAAIGQISTGFASKFGIPRGSGLVPEICGKITFYKPYSSAEYFRGIEQFSHIWVLWGFSESPESCIKSTVRPPRLGGNTRLGVFATRSPFRPNAIGISVLALESVHYTEGEGTVLYVKGADMLDGTPIYDIKPYIPFTDSIPYAAGGFAEENYNKCLRVKIPEDVLSVFPENHRDELFGILSQDPRPAYIDDGDRTYSFEFYSYRISFRVKCGTLEVFEIYEI